MNMSYPQFHEVQQFRVRCVVRGLTLVQPFEEGSEGIRFGIGEMDIAEYYAGQAVGHSE